MSQAQITVMEVATDFHRDSLCSALRRYCPTASLESQEAIQIAPKKRLPLLHILAVEATLGKYLLNIIIRSQLFPEL